MANFFIFFPKPRSYFCNSDADGMDRFLFTIVSISYAATGNRTHSRAAPDWDPCRALYRLSCTAAALNGKLGEKVQVYTLVEKKFC